MGLERKSPLLALEINTIANCRTHSQLPWDGLLIFSTGLKTKFGLREENFQAANFFACCFLFFCPPCRSLLFVWENNSSQLGHIVGR